MCDRAIIVNSLSGGSSSCFFLPLKRQARHMFVGKVVRKKLEMSLKFISFNACYARLCPPLSW